MKQMDKGIKITGMLEYDSYFEKLKMMDTYIFKLDMKLYGQLDQISFFDADFANTLTVMSEEFGNKKFGDVCSLINASLNNTGY